MEEVTRHLHPWPERIIDLPAKEKARLMLRDSDRYYAQCRAERLEQIRDTMRQPLEEGQ